MRRYELRGKGGKVWHAFRAENVESVRAKIRSSGMLPTTPTKLVRLKDENDQTGQVVWEFSAPSYCLDCGFLWPSKEYEPGSTWMTLLLLLLFFLPGAIYFAWRLISRYQGCASCGSKRIIPAASPTAQAAMEKPQHSGTTATPNMARFCVACGQPIGQGNRFCGNCGNAVESAAAAGS